ncbi:hypothetical protein RFI_33702, partial [Reticulomyxa filosa]
ISLGLPENGHRILLSDGDEDKIMTSVGNTPQPTQPSTPAAVAAKRHSGKMKRISLFSLTSPTSNSTEVDLRTLIAPNMSGRWRQIKESEKAMHTSTSAVTEISLGYLRALVNNFVDNMQPYESYGLNPVDALALAMLHLCSPHQEARKLAAKLADVMKRSRTA